MRKEKEDTGDMKMERGRNRRVKDGRGRNRRKRGIVGGEGSGEGGEER